MKKSGDNKTKKIIEIIKYIFKEEYFKINVDIYCRSNYIIYSVSGNHCLRENCTVTSFASHSCFSVPKQYSYSIV